jgi:hypothetical protein
LDYQIELDALNQKEGDKKISELKEFQKSQEEEAKKWHADAKTATEMEYAFQARMETDKWKNKDLDAKIFFEKEKSRIAELSMVDDERNKLNQMNQSSYDATIAQNKKDKEKELEALKHSQQEQEIQYVNALGEALHRVFSKSGNELIGLLQRAVEIWKLILMLDNAKGGASAMDYISTGVGILSFLGKTSTGGRSDQLTESSASYSLAKSSPRGFSSTQIIMPERMRVDVDNGVAFVTKWTKYDKDKHIN